MSRVSVLLLLLFGATRWGGALSAGFMCTYDGDSYRVCERKCPVASTDTEGKCTEERSIDAGDYAADLRGITEFYDNANLTTIDVKFFPADNSIERLQLVQNDFGTLNRSEFLHLVNLKHLFLESDNIHTPQEDVFEDCKNLRTLFLKNNRISALVRLGNLPLLDLLDLSNNSLQEIPENSFVHYPMLTHLYLASNQLISLHENAFSGLNNLNLLILKDNQLATVQPFGVLPALIFLDLGVNKFTEIKATYFENLPKLKLLSLNTNEIAVVEPCAFCKLTKLEMLNLNNNKLTEITKTFFDEVNDKRFNLLLVNNRISTIEPQAFVKLPKMMRMYLSKNELVTLQDGTFDGLESVQLDLNDNKLTFLPPAMLDQFKEKGFDISIRRNPWRCACLDDIVHKLTVQVEEYTNDPGWSVAFGCSPAEPDADPKECGAKI